MSFQVIERDELDRGHVGRFENNRRRTTCFQCFFPSRNAQTPSVSRDEAGELVLRNRRHKIVANFDGEFKKRFCHLNAHDVQAVVSLPRTTVAVAIEPGHWVAATGDHIGAEYVLGKFHIRVVLTEGNRVTKEIGFDAKFKMVVELLIRSLVS